RHGRPRWLHLGKANAIGLREARQLAAEVMLAVAKGQDPAADKRAARTQGTFAELTARYLTTYASKRNKSWRQGAHMLERWVLPRWGQLTPNAITRADVRALLGQLGHAPMLANRVLATCSAVFSWAVRQDILPNNPCARIERNPPVARD